MTDTELMSTPGKKYLNHRTQTLVKNSSTSRTYASETHQQLSILVAQEAHTVPGVLNKGHPADWTTSQTHAIVNLWLHKLWRQLQRRLDEPLYLKEPVIPQAPCPTRTPLTSKTLSTLLWGDSPEAILEGLEDLEDPEGWVDPTIQAMFPPLISSPSNQMEM
jgi:hypothetical protein